MSNRQGGMKRKATETGELKAKRAKGETNLTDSLKWEYHGAAVKGTCPLLYLSSATLPGAVKAAGFDIDFTVIKTVSGSKFATGSDDWEWWDEKVPDKLRQLHAEGYRVIFFTNQAGIEKLKVTPESFTKKVEDMIEQLGIPILAFVCTGENHFRKPSTMMWEYWEDKCNQGVKVNRSKCLYIGDAAGRAKNWAPKKPKDFSCSDRKFAVNLGVEFKTPEEFFLGENAAPFVWGGLDPSIYTPLTKAGPSKKDYTSKSQEVIIMVGPPASGKSTFRKRYLESKGYVAVNKDTMDTMAACIKAAKAALSEGKSVVADNTNTSIATRQNFVDCAKKSGVPCRCFVMKTPLKLAHHLNYVRQNHTNGNTRRVPDIAYSMYKNNFQQPTKAEGFSEILEIDFYTQFEDKRHEKMFKQWTYSRLPCERCSHC